MVPDAGKGHSYFSLSDFLGEGEKTWVGEGASSITPQMNLHILVLLQEPPLLGFGGSIS